MSGSVTHDPPSTAAGRQGRPLIVTEDVCLLDDLLRLCAAAGATPEVHPSLPRGGGVWESAPLILVGDDAARRARHATRRQGVVLVGRDQDDSDVWRLAVEIGADNVMVLPDGEQWLIDRIADLETLGASGAEGETTKLPAPAGFKAPLVLAVGLGAEPA
ncbi:hypothetical protein ACVNF4_31420, partial [Streptomyces sp. S6]